MTSLAQQLKQLAVPQTQALLGDDSRKASFLYDPKKAATINRETFFSIGINGLQELESLDESFAEFESSLFSESSLSFERSIQTQEVNEQVNCTIDAFLFRLSSHLQLKPAQKALEWLIQRYRVHLNNVDSLVLSFLPYHETKLFVVMLQLLDLSSHQLTKWNWLQPLQKSGVHLTRTTLVNHCITNPAFLALITGMVPRFIKAFEDIGSNQPEQLRVIFNFYTSTLIGVLHTGPVSERLVSAILPAMSKGFKSRYIDFKASSYMVLSQLMHKSMMKGSLLETLMNSVCKNLSPELDREAVCVLLLMFQTQDIDKFTKKSFKHICRMPSLVPQLSSLSSTFQADRMASALLRQLIPAAMKQIALGVLSSSSSGSEDLDVATPQLMSLVYDIMANVVIDTNTVTLAARLILENFVLYCTRDEGNWNKEDCVSRVKKLVRLFETRYAEALDTAVDSVMTSAETDEERQAVKDFLNLSVSSVHHRLAPDSQATLALCLNHRHSTVRRTAVKHLMDNLHTLEDLDSVRESLLARLHDDSHAVVKILLEYPDKLWTVFSNKEELCKELLRKLKTTDTNVNRVGLVSRLLIVLFQVVDLSPVRSIAVALSYLFLASDTKQAMQLSVQILDSKLASSSTLLSYLKQSWLPQLQKCLNASEELTGSGTQLNKSLIQCLSEFLVSAQEDPACMIAELYSHIDMISSSRQEALACLLCDVALSTLDMAKDANVTSTLRLQFTAILKDILFERKLSSVRMATKENGVEGKDNPVEAVMKSLEKGHKLPATWIMSLIERWMRNFAVPSDLAEKKFWQLTDTPSGAWLRATINMTEIMLLVMNENSPTSAAQEIVKRFAQVFPTSSHYLSYLCMLWTGVGDKTGHLSHTPALQPGVLQMGLSFLDSISTEDIINIVDSSSPVVPCLLTLCTSDVAVIRSSTLKCMSILVAKCSSQAALYKTFLKKLVHYQQEIIRDATYLPLAVASVLLSKNLKKKGKEASTLECLVDVTTSTDTPTSVVTGLLQALSRLDSVEMLDPFIPLMAQLLGKNTLSEDETAQLQLLVAKFTLAVAPSLSSKSQSLALLISLLKRSDKLSDGTSVQETAIKRVKEIFSGLPDISAQSCIIRCLVDVLQTTTVTSLATQIRKVFKHVTLAAELLKEELSPILKTGAACSVREAKRQRKSEGVGNETPFESPAWQRVIILLEMMQAKKKIPDGATLIPVIFSILSRVLELENGGNAEYLKQLLLGVIYNLCRKQIHESRPVEEHHLNIDAIVQCIRSSDNPHTHQQALLLLTIAAKIAPEQLLHSMMSVFTFMGANILRQDDSYTFRVITRILETVFPVLFMACEERHESQITDMVTMVLRVFVDAYPHIPEHRKLMVFTTLLRVVGVESYMWRLLLVFIEGVAVRNRGARSVDQTGEQEKPLGPIGSADTEFLVALVSEFSSIICLETAHQMVKYLAQLPDEKTDEASPKVRGQPESLVNASKEDCEIFSLVYNSAKNLRHFKYATVVTLCHLLTSNAFVSSLSNQLNNETMGEFRHLLETVLQFVVYTSHVAERLAAAPTARFWRAMSHKCYDLLDSLVTLLPQEHFLVVVSGLMDSRENMVQRKAMELLSLRLQHSKDPSNETETAILLEMVGKLKTVLKQIAELHPDVNEELAITGQTALYTLKLLCRLLGTQNHNVFLQVLQQACALMANNSGGSALMASSMLFVAEAVSCLRAYCIVHLTQIVPPIMTQLESSDMLENDVLMLSCITSLHKIVETLPHFLTPYLQNILSQVCYLSSLLSDAAAQKAQIVQRLKLISNCLATSLPARVLIPTITSCYNALLDSRQESVENLLLILDQHIQAMSREDISSAHHQLLAFFLLALDFRIMQQKKVKSRTIARIEGAVISTIITMVLKMSEATFRPMLLKIFEWATLQSTRNERTLVFYRLADSLVEKLRGLFLLFAAHVVKHAAQLLDMTNKSKTEGPYFLRDKKEKKVCKLLSYVLGCLQKCFLYDADNFINKERFDLLMQPLVDQIENSIGGEKAYTARVKEYLVPAIANFAAAVHDDSLWKTLNYQLMLKTRSSSKEVRLAALAVLEEFHKKLGEDYLPLLPETIPFLAELMEDESEEVENTCHRVIGEMEKTLGEPLQKYF